VRMRAFFGSALTFLSSPPCLLMPHPPPAPPSFFFSTTASRQSRSRRFLLLFHPRKCPNDRTRQVLRVPFSGRDPLYGRGRLMLFLFHVLCNGGTRELFFRGSFSNCPRNFYLHLLIFSRGSGRPPHPLESAWTVKTSFASCVVIRFLGRRPRLFLMRHRSDRAGDLKGRRRRLSPINFYFLTAPSSDLAVRTSF